MAKGGIIIRLIDVAMIILFGFIAISDIKVRAQIKLPADRQEEPQQEQTEPAFIFVKIDAQDGYILEAGDEVKTVTQDARALEQSLVSLAAGYKQGGQQAIVLIEPDEASMIQYTVDALDMCERNNLARNINYESMQF